MKLLKKAPSCVVCGQRAQRSTATWKDNADRTITTVVCGTCGFCQVEDNPWHYGESGFTTNSTIAARVGKADAPGREFHMCSLGAHLHGGSGLNVLISGSGLSLDWQHVGRLDSVDSVSVSDVENFTDYENFVSLDQQGSGSFDLGVACEVVEHFTDPLSDFGEILSNLTDDGVFIASTNINDGSNLSRHWYPFIPGHVSYWSAPALAHVGERHGFQVDFRVPEVALAWGGPRKRYAIMYRNPAVAPRIAEWFSSHPFAPSETDNRKFRTIGA